jgi:O-antigen biosynthesis protein WbqP
MDRLIATVIFICLLPVILVLLIITALDLKCSPIFVQKRTVSGELEFDFYKIRSMVKIAPVVPTSDLIGAKLYITRWGNFLRMYSLDELLNLICIIKGDMKFLGPRPIMLCENELINMRSKNKVSGKAGITGLAQVNGRDLISMTKKVACERYFKHRRSSVRLRLYIVFKTLVIVIRRSNIIH